MKTPIKKLTSTNLIALFLLFLTACDSFYSGPENLSKADFTSIKINNDYVIDLPSYMSEGELHDEASIEYQHLFKETYFIILDESISEVEESILYFDTYKEGNTFMQNYIDFQKDGFGLESQIISMGTTKDLTINGLRAKQFDMKLKSPEIDENIFYLATFIESNQRIYMLLSWTLESRENRYIDTYKKIANSFKLQKRRSKAKVK